MQPGAEVKQVRGNQCMHSKPVNTIYVPYSSYAELGIYPHKACGSMLILEERSHT